MRSTTIATSTAVAFTFLALAGTGLTGGSPARRASASPDENAEGLSPPARQTAATAPVPSATATGEVRCLIDFQGHPAMHFAWKFFGKGLKDESPRDLTWQHMFKQVYYAPYFKASGVRIVGAAAMAAERAANPEQARRLILEQIEFVDSFVATHSDDYAIARTPAEARRILATTNKIVIVHQIEGGRKILQKAEDAAFWRRQGVSLITLIHLWDDELGGAAVNPGFVGALINPHGSAHPRRERGLTERGRNAILELARAGIILDMSHMSPDSLEDALEVCREHEIPPVVTHGMFKPIQDSQRGLTEAQVIEIYKLGGLFSMPVDGHGTEAIRPTIPIPPGLVAGTQDIFKFHAETVHAFLRRSAARILGKPWEQLGDAERTKLAIGWASDWNGWVNHSKPTPRRPGFPRGPELVVDRVGLAHPGLLPQYFQRLRESGLDLDPFQRSAERFLQIWERIQAEGDRASRLSAPAR